MDFFAKKEPHITADTPVISTPVISTPVKTTFQAPPVSLLPGAGGLSQSTEEILRLSRENNRMLRHMQTMGRWAFWVKLFVWALVLGLPVIFFKPILEFTKKAVTENPAMFGLPTSEEIHKAIENFQNSQKTQ